VNYKHFIPKRPSEAEIAYLRRYTIDTARGLVFFDGHEVGHKNNHGYFVISGLASTINSSRKKHLRHHVIWWAHYGVWPANLLDHDDGNITNDAVANLRLSTTRDNSANSPRKRSGGLPTGVMPAASSKSFEARIVLKTSKGHRAVYLGSFSTPELAGQAYLIAKDRIAHGLPARANQRKPL
jgi:hypothetical protein